MILGFEPIHLQPLLSALRQQVDLAVLPAGQDPFASEAGRAAITEAVLSVRAYVEDNCACQPPSIQSPRTLRC